MKEFAYPFPGETNANGEVVRFAEPGLTKLEYFAAEALQGILANHDLCLNAEFSKDPRYAAEMAVNIAIEITGRLKEVLQ